jgi:hypothetical protein
VRPYLAAEKEHAQWSTDILTKMSEMQLSQYRNKRNMLLTALDAGGRGLHEAIYGPGGGAGGIAATNSITSGA